jgi:hypothetical protein
LTTGRDAGRRSGGMGIGGAYPSLPMAILKRAATLPMLASLKGLSAAFTHCGRADPFHVVPALPLPRQPAVEDPGQAKTWGAGPSAVPAAGRLWCAPATWLRAGEALSAALLTATMHGAATAPMSDLIEVDASRRLVRRLLAGRGHPQFVMRCGTRLMGDPIGETPRRDADEVIESHRPSTQNHAARTAGFEPTNP